MPWSSDHIKWLIDTGKRIVTSNGKLVPIWELKHENDDKILSAWAKHFRNHYCRDTDIDDLIDGTIFAKNPYPRAEYLTNIKFPDAKLPPGPSVRSGDFGEILIADYVEYVLNFWVPRTRFCDRMNRNDPSKGESVVCFCRRDLPGGQSGRGGSRSQFDPPGYRQSGRGSLRDPGGGGRDLRGAATKARRCDRKQPGGVGRLLARIPGDGAGPGPVGGGRLSRCICPSRGRHGLSGQAGH